MFGTQLLPYSYKLANKPQGWLSFKNPLPWQRGLTSKDPPGRFQTNLKYSYYFRTPYFVIVILKFGEMNGNYIFDIIYRAKLKVSRFLAFNK